MTTDIPYYTMNDLPQVSEPFTLEDVGLLCKGVQMLTGFLKGPVIYAIENKINNKKYIGSTKRNAVQRIKEHRRELHKGSHYNKHLQRAWDKHGKENFSFYVVEAINDVNKLFEREQHYFDLWKVTDEEYGYNESHNAGGGGVHNEPAWELKLEELEEFITENNRFPNSESSNRHEQSLGRWRLAQIKCYKGKQLLPRRTKRLETLPNWTWNIKESRWQANFDDFAAYRKDTGNYPSPGTRLSAWWCKQCEAERAGKLPEDRKNKLLALGCDFRSIEKRWEDQFAKLQSLGRFPYPEEDSYRWATRQREKIKEGSLTKYQHQKLHSLSFWEDNPIENNWMCGFSAVVEFCRQHGQLPSITKSDIKEKKLGEWCAEQRKRKDKLTPKRLELLQGLTSWSWDRAGEVWWQTYSEVKGFVISNNKLPRHIENKRLYEWVRGQKRMGKAKLHLVRVKALETLPVWVW